MDSVMEKYGLQWNQHGEFDVIPGMKGLLYLHSGDDSPLKGCSKIAGFDIDCTIITTQSGKTFATNIADWKWLFDCVPAKLKELHDDDYRIVFFTNQAGIEKKAITPAQFQTKIENIICKLELPIYVFAATGMNHFRKPNTEMWKFMVEECNEGVKVNLADCFYVGDGAGRVKNWAPQKKKDFSCGDRKFAANIGIKFYTPEEFFMGEKSAPFEWLSFDPSSFNAGPSSVQSPSKHYHASQQELVVMVGMPASGKSTFCKRYFEPHGYVVINRDTLKTQAKCIKVAEEALESGKSVVIDNTNPSKKDRAFYITLAKKYGSPTRCFHLVTEENIAHHLNFVRQNETNGQVRRIPSVVYNIYKKNLEKPAKSEGFSSVTEVPFSPLFDSDKVKEHFMQWTE